MGIIESSSGEPFVRTLRAQWLGQQLRSLREQCGLSLADVAASTGRPPTVWDGFERADWPIGRGDIATLLDVYEVDDHSLRERLLNMADQAWRLHRWDNGHHQHDETMDPTFITVDWLASRAVTVQAFALVVPIKHLPPPTSVVPVSLVVAQTAVERLAADALAGHVGIAHLAELASLSHVRIRVLPDTAAPWSAAVGGFTVFTMPGPYPPVAYQDGMAGRLYIEGPTARRFLRVFQQLHARALDASTSQR